MAILKNKVLYVLKENENVYEEFRTVKDEVFLTADTLPNDIYTFGGIEYNIAIKSPNSQKVIRVYQLNKNETISRDISSSVLDWDLDFKYQQGMTSSGSISLMNLHGEWNPHPLKNSIWKGSKFKIEIGIYYNELIFWRDCGIFVCGDISSNNGTISFPIYDKFACLDGTISGKRAYAFSIPARTKIKEALQLCLSEPKDSLGAAVIVSELPSLENAITLETLPNNVPTSDIGKVYYISSTQSYYYWSASTKAITMDGSLFTVSLINKTYRFSGNKYNEVSNEVFDMKPIIFPIKYLNEVTPYTITKEPNSTIGSIIIELADMISCDVSYNTHGNLTLTAGAVTNDDLSQRSILWNYNEDNNCYSQPTYDIKFSQLFNQIIVAGCIESGYQYKATAVNSNPQSQMNIYMTEPSQLYINDKNIVGDDYCKTRSRYEMIKQGRLSVQIKFKSIYIPHLYCNGLFLFSNEELEIKNEKFIINAINISSDMSMSITASNVNEVTF